MESSELASQRIDKLSYSLIRFICSSVDSLILSLCALGGEILLRPRSQNLAAGSMA